MANSKSAKATEFKKKNFLYLKNSKFKREYGKFEINLMYFQKKVSKISIETLQQDIKRN